MNNKSPRNVDLWFVNEDDLRNAANGTPFTPAYRIFAYFRLIQRFDENTMQGWIGHTDNMDDFHCSIDTTYGYFKDYRENKKVYVTLDKTTFFEIEEIFPTKPLLFILKRIRLKTFAPALIAATVHPLPFHLLGGNHFERLVFAFLQQTENWKTIEWLGEAGRDKGKDIWAQNGANTYCFQCVNYRQLTSQKIIADMGKLENHQSIPDYLTIVCGGKVTYGLREKARSYGTHKGIKNVAIWSGPELEEKIRKQAPDILQRFFEGQAFPTPSSVF
jgi:hypothetical protein